MRLYLCLVSALITTLNAETRVTAYPMPNGIPNGAVITFFFWHEGDSSELESVNINFYDMPSVDVDSGLDITAHLRIERSTDKPVASNTYVNGKWQSETKGGQVDDNPPQNGYWRVDVIKIDSERLNVFFQGFWSDVRSFQKSLDNVRSIYILKHHDPERTYIRLQMPNGNIAPLSFDQFKTNLYARDEKTLFSFPHFPVGSYMTMTAVMASWPGYEDFKRIPSLVFKAKDSTNEFLRIYHEWNYFHSTNNMYIDLGRAHASVRGTCIDGWHKPNGDLQHMRLKRNSIYSITLQVFFKQWPSGYTCSFQLLDFSIHFDKPFEIKSEDGAVLFHLDHSVPK